MENSEKNIEVELRGQLTAEAYNELLSFMTTNAKKVESKKRTFIDYSTFLPGEMKDRTTDIRLRITNGIPEIMVKLGNWGGVDKRKELSVNTAPGTFDTLVEIFAALGYEKGVLCNRNIEVYEYKDIEFALVEVPGHSYYFEAEKMVHSNEDMERVTKEITDVCKELELPIFTAEEFFEYIRVLNSEANEVFEFSKEGVGLF